MINLPSQIYLKTSHNRGLGVFARDFILCGDVIEDCPLLTLPIMKGENSSLLINYRFNYPIGKEVEEQVIALGYGSFYNHSNNPNAIWINHPVLKRVFRFIAIKNIEPNEEIFVFYGDDNYWSDGRSDVFSKIV